MYQYLLMEILIREGVIPPKMIYVQLLGYLTLKYVSLLSLIFYQQGEEDHIF